MRGSRGICTVGGCFGESHDAVEAVVIGECECFQPEPGGLLDEFVRMRGTVEKTEVGMAVQFGVRN